MNTERFSEIWDLHTKWASGVIYSKIETLGTATVFTSDVPGEYFNFAVPTVDIPDSLNLDEIKNTLHFGLHKSAVSLFESHQQSGFIEYLAKNKFEIASHDSWLLFNKDEYSNVEVIGDIREVGLEKLGDFYKVARPVWDFLPGNEEYLAMEAKFLRGEAKSALSDLQLRLYVLYEAGEPVANGGLFYSVQENFGYLQDAGTLKDFRGRGYQTSLIRHRINESLKNGISRLYVSAEHEGTSWRNCLKNGFEPIQVIRTFLEKGNVSEVSI